MRPRAFLYLTTDVRFNENKDLVGTVVAKRNSIIHYNDEAMDISFTDLLYFIDVFLVYMDAVMERSCQCRVTAKQIVERPTGNPRGFYFNCFV